MNKQTNKRSLRERKSIKGGMPMLCAIQSDQRCALQNAIRDHNATQPRLRYRILDTISECVVKRCRQPLTNQRRSNARTPNPSSIFDGIHAALTAPPVVVTIRAAWAIVVAIVAATSAAGPSAHLFAICRLTRHAVIAVCRDDGSTSNTVSAQGC